MKYMAYWGERYSQKIDLIDQSFFSEENGYTVNDIATIEALPLYGVADLTDLSGVHIVTRVE